MSNFISRILKIQKGTGKIINKNELSKRDNEKLTTGNVIYIYSGPKHIYVGQTKQFFTRHDEHCAEENGRYIDGSYDQVIVTFSNLITQNSLDDIERQLITYITSDYEHSRTITVDNGTNGNDSPSYRNQDEVASDFIIPFWAYLYEKKIVKSESLDAVKESILYKYSPFNKLSDDKIDIIDEISKTDGKYLVEGLAGTGKTIVLTNLVAKLHKKNPSKSIAVVCKSNWEKSGKNIFSAYGIGNVDVTTAFKLIRDNKKYDYILVDEAHRLNRYYSKGNHVTKSIFKTKDGYSSDRDELDMIKDLSSNMVLFYDPTQAIRPDDIPYDDYKKFLTANKFIKLTLTKEYRINVYEKDSRFTSNDFLYGIQSFLQIDERPFDKGLFRSYLTNEDSYFGVVDSIEDLFDYLNVQEAYVPNTQNRVLAGYTRKWISKGKANKDKYDWEEGSNHWQWNSTNENWINKNNSRNEIGSIHAIQGIDLNYAGVIVSKDINYVNGKVIGNQDNYLDANGTFKKEDNDPEQFTEFIKNIYYVLLTRGINGVRVYFEDPSMERYFNTWISLQ